ncbi:MAG: flagellar biosynthetic protein FliR [Planctomycetota bacterium]
MTVPLNALFGFFMVLTRLTGLFLVAPIFSNIVISIRIKAALIIALSAFLTSVQPHLDLPPLTMSAAVPGVISEVLTGVLLGFGFRMAMAAASIAGEIVGLNMGIGMARLLDPNSGLSAAMIQTFYGMLFTIIFLMLDGHHHLLRILNDSFATVPPGKGLSTASILPLLVSESSAMMGLGVRLAAPVLLPLFLLTTAIALISRAFPQANIITFAYGASAVVGMILIALSLPGLYEAFQESLRGADRFAFRVIQALSGA